MHVLALFQDIDSLANVVTDLRTRLTVPVADIEVITGAPYTPEAVGLEAPRTRIPQTAFVSWFTGGLLGFGLAAGTMMAYPIVVGGKPIPSLPPSFIITYELAMLTTIVVTVGRTLYEWGLPSFKWHPYDVRVVKGNPAVAVDCHTQQRASQLLEQLRDRPGLIDARIVQEGQD